MIVIILVYENIKYLYNNVDTTALSGDRQKIKERERYEKET